MEIGRVESMVLGAREIALWLRAYTTLYSQDQFLAPTPRKLTSTVTLAPGG